MLSTVRGLLAPIAVVFVGLALTFVGFWANKNKPGFLTVPDWTYNIYPWHPVLLTVAFGCQLLATLSWQLPFQSHGQIWSIQKLSHIFFNTIGLVALTVGLYAVVKYKIDTKQAHLATIHEWNGLLIFILVVTNVIGASSFAFRLRPHSAVEPMKIHTIRLFHKLNGAFILILSTMNIMSGIVQLQPGCIIKNKHLEGCEIANVLGIVVLFASLAGLTAVLAMRYNVRKLVALPQGFIPVLTQEQYQQQQEQLKTSSNGKQNMGYQQPPWTSDGDHRAKR